MKFFSTIIFLIILSSFSFAQLNYIPLNVDFASFKGNDNKSFTEFYLSFYQFDLEYEQNDSIYTAKFSHRLKITQGDSVIYNLTRNYRSSISENESQLNNQFVDVFAVELLPGTYTVVADITDKTANKNGEYILNASISDFNNNFSISNIQFANSIDPKGDSSNFSLKNNIKILPNASKTFTIINPMLYFYFEAYNLTVNKNGQSNYSYNYYISNLDGRRIRDYAAKEKTGSASIAEVSGINVIALEGKPYFLNINVADNLANKSITTRKIFTVKKPIRKKSEQDITAKIEGYEEYIGLNKEQLIREFEISKYIASNEEVDIFEKMVDAQGMRRFLSNFWKSRDENKSSAVNEYRLNYIENYKIANANYSTNFKEGWRTDRGRVVLIYGRPDEIERNANTLDSQPFEIWHFYSLEGGTQFIFADVNGNGNYELLHSTFRNEIKDPDWHMRVDKLGSRNYNSGFDDF